MHITQTNRHTRTNTNTHAQTHTTTQGSHEGTQTHRHTDTHLHHRKVGLRHAAARGLGGNRVKVRLRTGHLMMAEAACYCAHRFQTRRRQCARGPSEPTNNIHTTNEKPTTTTTARDERRRQRPRETRTRARSPTPRLPHLSRACERLNHERVHIFRNEYPAGTQACEVRLRELRLTPLGIPLRYVTTRARERVAGSASKFRQ